MPNRISNYRLFWREFRRTFHTTGAVLPSGRRLARSLASQISNDDSPKYILEVGPGTGAVTQEIILRMGPSDRLDLVELNESFVEVLRRNFAEDPALRAVSSRVRVLQMPVEELRQEGTYSHIISGLPLNNFAYDSVCQIFKQFYRVGSDGCLLSFFEYIGIRKAKALVTSSAERQRLLGIDCLLQREFATCEISRQCVLANVPPAWVHHLCLPKSVSQLIPVAPVQPATC